MKLLGSGNNTRLALTAIWTFFLLASWGCSTGDSQSSEGSTVLRGKFPSCEMDSFMIYSIDGFNLKKLASAPMVKSGDSFVFNLSAELPEAGMYYIGNAPHNLTTILIEKDSEILISGNCNNLRGFSKIEGSPLNDGLDEVNRELAALNKKAMMLKQEVGAIKVNNNDVPSSLLSQQQGIYERQFQLLDSLKTHQPLLAKMIAPSIFGRFDPNDNPQNYKDEIHHLAGEMFSAADLSDPSYAYLPIADYLRAYVVQVFGGGMDQQEAEQYLDKILNRLPEGSQSAKNAMASIVNVMSSMKSFSFPRYAERYISNFSEDPTIVSAIQRQIQEIERLKILQEQKEEIVGIGKIPPEVNTSVLSPDGKNINLTSLKGKVVLLDFWASWCGPCRGENPNVVKLYNQYKDQGFEILSISLDRERGKWLEAIKADKMDWLHVSDLRGWQNQMAQDYMVRAIPETYLLNKTGKIIAKNLRGKALAAELQRIFGS